MKSNLISAQISGFCLFIFLSFSFLAAGQDSTQVNADSLTNKTNSLLTVTEFYEEKTTWFPTYFAPIESSEAQANFDAINTAGLIEDFKLVPDPRTGIDNYSQVSDPHNILTSQAIDTLDKIMKRVEAETHYQMAVVCINSIGDENPNMFGTELFNHWGLGQIDIDNGFLLLVINDVHRVEFINGRKTETILTDIQGENIRQNEMIPHFKNNDYVTGIIRGIQCVADVFNNTSTEYEIKPINNSSTNSGSYNYKDYEYTPTAWYEEAPGSIYLLVVLCFTAVYLFFLILSFFIKDLHRRYHVLKIFTLLIFPILFPVPFLILYFLNRQLMNRWRDTERISAKSGLFMYKLDEQSDDAHLVHGQITEEVIKSIDYDVWVAEGDDDILILAYKKWFSKYKKCPSCKHKAYHKEYDRVISSATYSSSGTGERCYSCKSCNHSKVTRYTIPRKTKSANTSSSGGYGSSSSSGGSSSSSGSSWGGGSSGGGGGGSSW
jgi:uncharacterized protein